MRKIILSVLILFAAAAIGFSSMPAWVSNPYFGYSSDDYVCASGFGRTQDEADTEARKEIAGFFGTSVYSNTEMSASESSVTGYESSFSSAVHAKVDSDDIVGISIDRRYKENGQYASHAILSRRSACSYYSGQIETYAKKITDASGYVFEDLGSMYALEDLADLTDAVNRYQKSLRIYNALSPEPYSSTLTEVPNLNPISQQVLSSIEVSVKISGDDNGRIESAVKSFLTGCGLSVARRKARNVVDVSILFENTEVKGSPFKFCRYSISVSITDETFGEQVFEFSASGREGQNSYEQAKTRALSSVEKIIGNEFADKFEEKFGLRPNK